MSVIESEQSPSKEGKIPYKLIVFDMDGTLVDVGNNQKGSNKIRVGIWQVIFDSLGISYKHRELEKRFMTGKINYTEWTTEACESFKAYGLTQAKFSKMIADQPFMEGAKETVLELKKRGYKTAVITGGFSALARRIQKELGIDYAVAHCNLEFDEKGRLKGWKLLPCDSEGKADIFLRIAKKNKITSSECAYIGDETNDIPVFGEAGLSIAFNCKKKEVRDAADIVVAGSDLRLILPHIGIGQKPESH